MHPPSFIANVNLYSVVSALNQHNITHLRDSWQPFYTASSSSRAGGRACESQSVLFTAAEPRSPYIKVPVRDKEEPVLYLIWFSVLCSPLSGCWLVFGAASDLWPCLTSALCSDQTL